VSLPGGYGIAESWPLALRGILGRLRGSAILREIAGTFGTRVLLIAAGLVVSVLTTRMLGPEGRGIFAVASAASALCIQFGNLGLHASNTYTVVRNPETLPGLIANSIVVSLAVGAVVYGLSLIVASVAPGALSLSPEMRRLAVASVPLGLSYLLLQNLLIGTGRIRAYNVLEIALKIGGIVLLLALLAFRWVTPSTVFAVTVVTSAAGCIAVLWILPHTHVAAFRFDAPLMRGALGYGMKAYASALFAYVTLRFDLLMVEHYRGAIDAGYYSIAAAYGDLVYLLPTVVGTILFPRLSALPTDVERWALARRAAGGLGALMVVGVVAAALLAPFVVRILYGARFAPAIPAVLWLMPGLAFLSVNTVFMNYFGSIGMPPITVVAPAVAATANIALNTVLIPRSGIVGASIASTIAYALMLVCSLVYVTTRPPRREGIARE